MNKTKQISSCPECGQNDKIYHGFEIQGEFLPGNIFPTSPQGSVGLRCGRCMIWFAFPEGTDDGYLIQKEVI